MRQARNVLQRNWTGQYTRPSPTLYPHQWSWHSAFIAIGTSLFDTERACRELEHLFRHQWRNGLVPHIVFSEGVEDYFPGPRFWDSSRSADAPPDRATSGIVHPPIHATAVRRVIERMGDRNEALRFAERMYPKLAAWHAYLHRERDPDERGLVSIFHPWESGMGNSPVFDGPLSAMPIGAGDVPEYFRADILTVDPAQRPTNDEYDRYAYLVAFLRDRNYAYADLRREAPFVVEDVLFNAVFCRAERDLAAIAKAMGKDPTEHLERGIESQKAIQAWMWDGRLHRYHAINRRTRGPIEVNGVASYAPLFSAGLTFETAQSVVREMRRCRFLPAADHAGIMSYAEGEPGFSPERYWRGPVWMNINWMFADALASYGMAEQAGTIVQTSIDLVSRHGFREYFRPDGEAGLGGESFSWTAALALDMLVKQSSRR